MPKIQLSQDDLDQIKESFDELPDSGHLAKLISNAQVFGEWD